MNPDDNNPAEPEDRGGPQASMLDQAPLPIQKIINFFRDPERPMWQRAGAGAAVFFLFAYPLIAAPPQRASAPVDERMEESFPSGPAGLADSDPNADQMRALALEAKRKREEDLEAEALERRVSAESEPKTGSAVLTDAVLENAQENTPFTNLKRSAEPYSLTLTPGGGVLVADRKALLQFKAGDYNSVLTKLDAQIYDGEFNEDLSPISSALAEKNGNIWAGFIRGQLMRHDKFGWKILIRPGEQLRGPITAISEFGGKIRVGSSGLWKWNETLQRLVVTKTFESRPIAAFAAGTDGRLYAGGDGGIWAFNPETRGWSSFWRAADKDVIVHAIVPQKDGSFLVGTADGMVTLSDKAIIVERALPSERVISIAVDSAGGIWAGTRKTGLRYWNGAAWHKADSAVGLSNQINAVLADTADQIWVAAENKGLLVGKRDKIAEWMVPYADPELEDATAKTFPDICDAAKTLLPGVALSGSIALDSLDGKQLVFLDGYQRCPKGVGYRRPDGTLAVKDGWNITLLKNTVRKNIDVPQELPADTATLIYLDTQDRLWLGTPNGVLMHAGGEWKQFGETDGFANNAVNSILEDEEGGIWIGTTPLYDKQNSTYLGDNLHAFDDGQWVHLSPRQGLAHWAALTMQVLENGALAVGTNGGISVLAKTGETTSYGLRDGMSAAHAFSLTRDRQSNLWIAHQFFGNGVTWFDGSAFHRVDSNSGLFTNKIAYIAHDRKNRIWLVASNGETKIYLRSFFETNKTTVELPERRRLRLNAPPPVVRKPAAAAAPPPESSEDE